MNWASSQLEGLILSRLNSVIFIFSSHELGVYYVILM